jgi:copper(I)-binding protein
MELIALLAAISISVTNAIARSGGTSAAIYATIHNDGMADAIDRVLTPVGKATMDMSPAFTSGDDDPPALQVAQIAVPGVGTMELKATGYHVEITHLKHPLHAGQHIPLRLHFQREGWITVNCTVLR